VTTIPRDGSETLALLVSRGLLAAERDEGAQGRPNVYRPTPSCAGLWGADAVGAAGGDRDHYESE